MSQQLPSKNIFPNASLDCDVNSYAHESDLTAVRVDKAEFIKICENASVFPKGTYEVCIYTCGLRSIATAHGSPPKPSAGSCWQL